MNNTLASADDADLVRRALDGDRSAVAEIYDRYADHIYSFCRSRLRNDADAADATQDTFVRASTRLDQLQNPSKLRSWLFAIARNQIVASGRATARATGGDGMELIASEDDELDADLLRVEAASQLWDASAGLSERDQEVLELHVRHGLSGTELADALGVSESHSYVLLSRMRDRIASSLGGLLVARLGRDDCRELDQLLATWDGRFTLDVRSRVTRHVRSCEVCEQTHTTALASGVSFGVVPLLAVPGGLRTQTLDKMFSALDVSRAASGTSRTTGTDGPTNALAVDAPWNWKPDGFPTPLESQARRGLAWLKVAVAIAAVVMLVGAGGWLWNQPSSGNELATGDDAATEETEVLSNVAAPPPTEPSTTTMLETTTTTPETTTSTTSTTEQVEDAEENGEGIEVVPPPTSTAPETTTTEAEPLPVTDPAGEEEEEEEEEEEDEEEEEEDEADPEEEEDEADPAEEEEDEADPVEEEEDEADPVEEEEEDEDETNEEEDPSEPANIPPVILEVRQGSSTVQAQRAGACSGEILSVWIDAVDPDGEVVSVVLAWQPSPDSTTTTPTAVATGGPPLWFGQIGPWLTPGTKAVQVVATDDAGATTAAMLQVEVTACPFGFSA